MTTAKFVLPTLLVLGSIASFNAKAQSAIDLYVGFQKNEMTLAEVVTSDWLDQAEQKVERNHDFHENVSYVGEDWSEVEETCGFTAEQSEHVYDHSEVYTETQWKKIIKTSDKKTVAYVLYLFADISWRDAETKEPKNCLYRRGTYVVGRNQKEIDDSDLYNIFKLSFSSFL